MVGGVQGEGALRGGTAAPPMECPAGIHGLGKAGNRVGSCTRCWAAEHTGRPQGRPEVHRGQMDGFGGQAQGSQDKMSAAAGPHRGQLQPPQSGAVVSCRSLQPLPGTLGYLEEASRAAELGVSGSRDGSPAQGPQLCP